MLTKTIRKHICLRLGSHVKYSCTCIYYWDKSERKFVLVEGPYYWTWASNFYCSFFFETFLYVFLREIYKDLFRPEFKETGEESEENHQIKLVILISGILYWVLITGLLAAMSVINEYREEVCIAQNQIFKLDEVFYKIFVTDRNLPEPDYPEKKHAERLMIFDCYFPHTVPCLFIFVLFSPGEPLHSMMEWILEIKFGLNWETLVPWAFLVIGTNAFVAFVINIILLGVGTLISLIFWLRAACPNALSMRKNWDDGLLYFKTAQLGVVSEIELIWLFRSLQLQAGLLDVVFAGPRVAYHSFAEQVTLVIAMYTMVRFQNIIFTGTLLGFTLAAISVLGTFLPMFMMIVESFGLDEVQKRSEEFRDAILKGTKRSLAINKTVRSFKDITIHTAGSYYQVNKSSYLEWCDQAIDRLVTLLCTI